VYTVFCEGKSVPCLTWRYKPLRRTGLWHPVARGWEVTVSGGASLRNRMLHHRRQGFIYSCANASVYLKLHSLRVKEALR
jgi:hypothetical protein